ncbi:MAG TPA: transketolase C-terminal domain-containing protein [Nitrospirota bacterium]|nr:transketolase C-terminal domain-containing protein [Nitrospirota bacterium]
MRNVFAKELTNIAITDKRVVLLSGDIGNKLFDEFKKAAPERFYNCGVAEANMTGVAAGLALMGFRPITYTITPFATIRCIEQIRIDLCYHNVPVVIVGTGSGLSYAELGPTHHSCDDIGLLRMFPNMTIICPCDPEEVRLALREALKHEGPVYIRLGKKGEPAIHKIKPNFKIGKSITVKEGDDICILSTGTIISLSLSVAEVLKSKGISVRVESFHTVKPLDIVLLEDISQNYRLIATIEEHSLIGGLGGAVAEWIADYGPCKARLLRFGTEDRFLETVGSQEYARAYYGLTVHGISDKILKVVG